MTSFNVILPSDSNSKLYPGNTKSKYKVRLGLPVDLDQRGEWEVAVSDLHVPAKISKSFTLEAKLTHSASQMGSATATLEDGTSDLETKFNQVLGSCSVCETKCTYKVKSKIAEDGTVTIIFDYVGSALSPGEIFNVIFYKEICEKAPLNVESRPPKLVLGKELRRLLGLGGNTLDTTIYHKDEVLSPFPPLPRLKFDFNWYESPSNRELVFPLNLDTGKREEIENKHYYVMYMQMCDETEPKVVYIPKTVTCGIVGVFITILRYYIRKSDDRIKWTVLNYYPYHASGKSVFSIYLRVKKRDWEKSLKYYSTFMKVYINRDFAIALGMSFTSSMYLVFPNYNSDQNLGSLSETTKVKVMDLMTGTQWEQYSGYSGQYTPNVESSRDGYAYVISFKVRPPETAKDIKLRGKAKFMLETSVTLPEKLNAQNYVQWFNIHCPNLVQDNLLRAVSRPQPSSKTKVMSDIPMRHLHYKKLVPGTKRIQDFDIQFKDEHNEPVTFGQKGKTIMTVNFRPEKRFRLSHFNVNVPCQVKHTLQVPIKLDTTDEWEVALMDLSYPEKWKNVHYKELSFTLGMDGKYEEGKSWTHYMDPGYYTPAGLVDWIKRDHYIPKAHFDRVQVFYNEGKFTLGLRYADHSKPGFENVINGCMKIHAPLCYVLGFDEEVELDTTPGWKPPPNVIKTVVSIPGMPTYNDKMYKFTPREKKVDLGYRIFYVYAPDMCKDMKVGQYQTPLLQYFIPEDAEKRGRNKITQFNSLSYVGLKDNLHSLKEILVEIRDELGRILEFTDVDISPTATLNFRVKSNTN